MYKFFIAVSLAALSLGFTPAQSVHQKTELKQSDSTLFDFWIGDWETSWNENGIVRPLGENHIQKEFSGFVLRERFIVTEGTSKAYEGGSWTVYDKQKQKWLQTWVDNRGAYMTFEGKPEGENRIFERNAVNKNGQPIVQRAVFKDIAADSFTWAYQSSTDNGKT